MLGKIKSRVNDRVFLSRSVCHVDSDLTVLDLPDPAAPLTRHADRLGPLLGKARGVEHEHAIRFTQFRTDLSRQCHEQRPMVPWDIADEFLDPLSLSVM